MSSASVALHGEALARRATPGPVRVLLMDDDPMVREAGRAFLRHLGHETELAAGGEEAVERYRRAQAAGRPFDVVILDLTVPDGMGARQTMAELQLLDPAVCGVVTSGAGDDPVMADPAAYGFRAVLFKPWFPADLRRVLADVNAAPKG